jgi:DNA-binding beta-propeller fold protein YncE
MRTLIATIAAAATSAAVPAVVAKIPLSVGTAPCAAAAGGKYIWVSEYGSPYLVRIDPKLNKVVGKTHIGVGSCGLGYGAGSMWVEDTSSSTVSRVSVATAKRVAAIRVGITPYDATFAYGAAWTTANGTGELERIDPARNRVVKRWPLTLATGVVGAFGSVWAAGQTGVIRIDPATNAQLASIPVAGGAGWTAASADAVWVTTQTGLARIDPQTNAVTATVTLPGAPFLGDPGVVGGFVWVPQIRRNSIAVVDPAANAVVRTVKTGTGPFVVTQIAGQAWVPSWKGHDIWRFTAGS